jgi:hypothetical protein
MKLFSETLKKSDAKTARQFVGQLAKDIGGAKSTQIFPTVQKAVLNGLDSEVASAQIAKTLRNAHFDKVIRGGTHAVDSLLGDAKLFVDSVTKRASNPNAWNQAAKSVLTQTNRINAFRIPIGLGAGVAFNFAMPYMIQAFTRNISGINDYPGEMGLRELKHTDKEHDKKRGLFPYLKEPLQRGNILPLLVSFVPLPIVLGMIDTDKLSVHGLKASFNNPFKPGYMKRFMSMMQFSRKVPYIGGQQMALLYALVVFSRVAAARTSIEFRERTVDAFLGWSIWILANPWMKKKIAQWSDKAHGTKLMKTVGGLSSVRTEAEVKRLITNPVLRQKSLNRLTLISAGSTLATIFLLGIAEPYLSIRLTEWQAHKLNKKRPETTVE